MARCHEPGHCALSEECPLSLKARIDHCQADCDSWQTECERLLFENDNLQTECERLKHRLRVENEQWRVENEELRKERDEFQKRLLYIQDGDNPYEEIERLQAYPAAVDKIRSYYPIDVFPDDGDSKDCTGARFARSLCDQIHKQAAEAEEE